MPRLASPFCHRLLPVVVSLALATILAPTQAADVAPSAAKQPAKAAAKPAAKPAADKTKEAPVGKGSGPVMTKEELRACMTEDDRLKKETTDIVETQKALQKNRAEIARLGTEIETEKPSVDRTNQAAVDAFNEKVIARGKLLEQYQAAATVFNERVDKLAVGQESYAKDCGNRKYFESDYDDIKAGK